MAVNRTEQNRAKWKAASGGGGGSDVNFPFLFLGNLKGKVKMEKEI